MSPCFVPAEHTAHVLLVNFAQTNTQADSYLYTRTDAVLCSMLSVCLCLCVLSSAYIFYFSVLPKWRVNVLCGHPTPRGWTSQRRELSSRVGLFRSRLRTLGTHYHPTLDPAVLWTPSNDTSRPICSDSLNLMPPVPLYLHTLWRYTNAVIIVIIII